MRPLTLLVAASVLAAACRPAAESGTPASDVAVPVDTVALQRARNAANALGGDLVQMLTAELTRGGPEAAIAVCADSAQGRTGSHSTAGVSVRRVGTRLRNVANAPDIVERSVLDAFDAAIAEGRTLADTAFMATDAAGRPELRYLRAIRIQEMCLACHGQPAGFTPAVESILRERYPNDQATGYSVGQLRGAISVRVSTP